MFTSVSMFVLQVCYPKLGDLCWLVIPCALTTLDHWSPEVKVWSLFIVWFLYMDSNSMDCLLVPTLLSSIYLNLVDMYSSTFGPVDIYCSISLTGTGNG